MDKIAAEDRKKILLLYWCKKKKESKKRKINRTIWVRHIFTEYARAEQGAYDNLLSEMRLTDVDKYCNFCRMYPETFDKLLSLVGPEIKKIEISRKTLPPALRLSLCLRYLASGDSMVSMSYLFRVGVSTVSNIIKDTCEAIWLVLHNKVFCQSPSEIFWRKIANEFAQKWQFPNCIGAIDGKHIHVQAPSHSGSIFFNYKKTHSLVLLAVCDANYNFIYFESGFEGRQSDGGIFRRSIIGQKLENDTLNVPSPSVVSDQGRVLPHVLVGDEAFPLSKYMMRPFPGKNLSLDHEIYNYRLSRCRRIIENSFGILVAKWRIFRKPIIANIDTTNAIIRATLSLHNFIKCEEMENGMNNYLTPTLTDIELPDGTIRPGAWRINDTSIKGVQEISKLCSGNHTRVANDYREQFSEYFMEEGRVEWQWTSVNR